MFDIPIYVYQSDETYSESILYFSGTMLNGFFSFNHSKLGKVICLIINGSEYITKDIPDNRKQLHSILKSFSTPYSYSIS